MGWSCVLWLRWVDLGDLGWRCGLRPDHGSHLRLGFDLDWGSGLSFNGLILVRGESQWLCCVCGCGWEVEEEGWWWLDCGFFFFFSYGWWLPVEKWRKRKVVRSSYCCRNLWLWMVGQQWKWLLLLCCDVCCDGLVFFFPLFCWGFWIWNLLVVLLLMLLLLLIGVDVVAVVDDNREEIIYYFNV